MTEVISIEAGGAAARSALEACLGAGGVAAFPADGLYGLCCDPLDAAAIERIRRLKGREDRKPMAVMYFSPPAMRELLAGLGPRTSAAVGALLPGPVTLVLPNPERRYPLAGPGDPSRLGVRLIEGPLSGLMRPVLQTSANRSGQPPPAGFGEIDAAILEGVDLTIDGGALDGEPSTVIDLSALDEDGSWRLLRQGAVPAAEVEAALSTEGRQGS